MQIQKHIVIFFWTKYTSFFRRK